MLKTFILLGLAATLLSFILPAWFSVAGATISGSLFLTSAFYFKKHNFADTLMLTVIFFIFCFFANIIIFTINELNVHIAMVKNFWKTM